MPKLLEIRVGPPGDALDRFEAAWNRAAEGRRHAPLHVLSLESLSSLIRTLTPARWAMLENLRKEGACSIYELAKRLKRDYKNVHTDVTQLLDLSLVDKDETGRVRVPWDVVRAELRIT